MVKVMLGVVFHDCTASVLLHSCTMLHAAATTLSDADTIAAHTSQPSGDGGSDCLRTRRALGAALPSDLGPLGRVQGAPPRSILGTSQALDKGPKGCPGGQSQIPASGEKGKPLS